MSRWQYPGWVQPLAPTLPATARTAVSDDGVIQPMGLLQYQSVVGPILVPTAAPPTVPDIRYSIPPNPVLPRLTQYQYQTLARPLATFGSTLVPLGFSDPGVIEPIRVIQYQAYTGPVRVPSTGATLVPLGFSDPGVIEALKVIQYQAFTGPVLIPHPVPPTHFKPIYPDRIDPLRRGTEHHQALFWNTDTPPTPAAPLKFTAHFPDFASKTSIHASQIQSFFWGARTPTDGPVPLTWKPTYQDWIAGLKRTAWFQALSWGVNTPAVAPPTVFAWLRDTNQQVQVEKSLYAAHGPFFAGSALPEPEPVSHTAAMASTNDNGAIPRMQIIQYQALTGPVIRVNEVNKLGWIPRYPDRIFRRGGRQAQYAPYFGGFGLPQADISVYPGTRPIYPSIVWGKKLHASLMPFSDASPNPQVEIDRVNGAVVPLSWKSRYPDSIFRPSMPASLMMFFISGEGPATFAIPPLSWNGSYPDGVSRSFIHASQQRAFFNTFAEQGAPPPSYWYPYYESIINRTTYHPSLNAAFSHVRFIDPVPELSWKSIYPDAVDRFRLHPSALRNWLDVLSPIFPTVPLSLATYPDYISRLSFATAQQQVGAFGISNGQPSPELAWKPTFPDWIARLNVHPSFQPQPISALATTFTVTPLSWRAIYPDAVIRAAYLAAQQQAFVLGSFGTISIPEMSWTPRYPAWHTYPTLRNSSGVMNISPIPNPALVDLSWHPTFAAMVNRITVHPSNVPSAWWNTTTPTRFPYEWSMQHPTRPMARLQRPMPEVVTGRDVVVASPEAWRPQYPDRINRQWMNERPAIFQPPLSTFPSIGVTGGWRPEYPDQLLRSTRQVVPSTWWTIDPTLIALLIDCIELVDGLLTSPMLAVPSITEPDLIEESITVPTPDGEKFC